MMVVKVADGWFNPPTIGGCNSSLVIFGWKVKVAGRCL